MNVFLTAIFVTTALIIVLAASLQSDIPTALPPIVPSITQWPSGISLADRMIIPVTIDGQSYAIHARIVLESARVTLIANFAGRETGERLVQQHGCSAAINGGFYTKEGKPLGWFQTEGSTAGERIDSNLVTGFFWQDPEGKRHIGQTAPEKRMVDFVLQTGPYMEVHNARLRLIDDEPARRSLLALDEQSRLYLLAVTQKDAAYSGPFLADLPLLFSLAEVQKKIRFRTLLNLDGGSASFFYLKGTGHAFMLSELTPIGSIICVR